MAQRVKDPKPVTVEDGHEQDQLVIGTCKYCGLDRIYWDQVPTCPGRDEPIDNTQ